MSIQIFKILLILIFIYFKKLKEKLNNIPDISIIIPIYNNQKYLSLCLKSIIYQTLKNIEIICINDGSTDESLKILKEFKKIDNRIIILSQKNKGSAISRNKGIKKSKGKYLAFIDSDDMYPNNFTLELMYNKSIINNAKICGGGLKKIKEDKENIILINSSCIFNKEGMIDYFDYQYDFCFFRFIYNKKFLKKNNIYFPNYLRYQDPPFFIKAMSIAKKFYALNETTYLYRKDYKNITWNQRKVIDQFKGFNECLTLSKLYNLNNLYCRVVKHLNSNLFLEAANEFKNNFYLKSLITNILNSINFNKLNKENCKIKLNKIYKKIIII